MANDFIDIQSQAAVIATSFDNMSIEPLRPRYVWDALASEKRWNLNTNPNRGDNLVFPILSSQAANTAALDPTAAAITGSVKTVFTRRNVSLEAYGDHATVDAFEFRAETFVDDAAALMFTMQDQAMNSLNKIARAAVDLNRFSNETSGTISSTYHFYGSDGTVGAMGPLKAIDVRKVVSKMKADNVEPFEDGNYVAVVDPIQSTQLRAETGNAAWRAAAVGGSETGVSRVYNGDIGIFENVRFVVNTEIKGSGTNTLTSYFMGREGVGKAIGRDLQVRIKPGMEGPQNNLMVFHWNVLVGYKIIRREAIRTIDTNNTQL
jgi:hypothetical protein